MPDVYVSAGSNIAPQQHLRDALRVLSKTYSEVRCSPVYRNSAVGFSGDDFFNCVFSFSTGHDAIRVMKELRKIEDECGRDRSLPRFGPRSVDLDLLLYGDFVGEVDGLGLPRKEALEQAYILKPLVDLAPGLIHPVTGQSLGDHWAAFDSQAHLLTRVDLESD